MKRHHQVILHLRCLLRKRHRHWRFHVAGIARALVL